MHKFRNKTFCQDFHFEKLGLKAINVDETGSAFEIMHLPCLRHAITRVLYRNAESVGKVKLSSIQRLSKRVLRDL